MIINIFIIHESVFLLYKTMLIKIFICYHIREYIMTINNVIICERVFLIAQLMYNDNVYLSLYYIKVYYDI